MYLVYVYLGVFKNDVKLWKLFKLVYWNNKDMCVLNILVLNMLIRILLNKKIY